LQQKLLLASR